MSIDKISIDDTSFDVVKAESSNYKMPMLPLRGAIMLPYLTVPFDVGRESSKKAINIAMDEGTTIFLVSQTDSMQEDPKVGDFQEVGVICKINQIVRLADNMVRVIVDGTKRAKVVNCKMTDKGYFECEVEWQKSIAKNALNVKYQALKRAIIKRFQEFLDVTEREAPEFILNTMHDETPERLPFIMAFNVLAGTEGKYELLKENNLLRRMQKFIKLLTEETAIVDMEKDIMIATKYNMDKQQRDYFLREQVKVIQSELGDKDSLDADIDRYTEKLDKIHVSDEVYDDIAEEINKLSKQSTNGPEVSVIRNYLDWVFDIPWNKKTKDKDDLKLAAKILDRDHYGLEKIKERVLEMLAVKKLKQNLKGPILCFVGPPGTGKTSVAKSIAAALGRKYVRMSLGGVKDEAEIRGHRRTYIGAMPGRIIVALKQAKTLNPLLLFDEIDKMGNDYKGDPASAMLEVLDSNQNFEFRDHYIELPVDLSDVLFITTANTADTIPAALYDRMEIIELSGYTEEEKLRIGMDFLVKKQRKENGLKATQFKINEAAMRDIINFYTRESGVRTLERTIGKICRQVAAKIAEADEKSVSIGAKDLEKYLGQKKYRYEKINEVDRVGIANGLAWTSMGGDTLSIEVNVMRSSGNSEGRVELTGNLGDVMKESAMAAVSYIRSRYDDFGISNDFFKENDIHIHVPEGAVPKDGPSAGITIATSIISAMTGIPIKKDVAMTGEITIRGRILPIGGLKEKSLAARRAGISTILIPIDNEKDLEEIPSVVKDKIKFILAKDMDTVLLTALTTTDFKAAASMRVDLMESLKFKSKNEKEPNVTDNKKIVPAKPRESSIGTDGM